MRKALLFILLPFFASAQTKIGSDINGELAGEASGTSVAMSANGNIVAIGATLSDNNGTNSGCVRIYKNISGAWVQQGAAINGENAGNQSGSSVAISADGSIVAIGAAKNNVSGTNSGQVRIYRNIAGTWTQEGADIDGQNAGEHSGFSISLSADGSTIAIGVPYNTNNGNDSGLVRVYKNTAGTWTQQGPDVNSGTYYDASGRSVSLSADGNTVAIGAPYNSLNGGYAGRVRIYKYEAAAWTQQGADIRGLASNVIFGYSLSLSSDGSTVAVGGIGNGPVGSNSGQVGVYKNIAGTWTQQGAIIGGQAVNDTSGRSVSLSGAGDIVVIGANGHGSFAGNARIYRNISGNWVMLGVINGEAAGDNSGSCVSLSTDGTTLAIGSPNNNFNGTNAGQARVYDLSALLASGQFVLENFSIYPNPASESLNIRLAESVALQRVNIYNDLGQLVKKANTAIIDVGALSGGTYFVEVVTDKGSAVKSIVVK